MPFWAPFVKLQSSLYFLEVCIYNAVIVTAVVMIAAVCCTAEAACTSCAAHIRTCTRLTAVLLIDLGGQCIECLLEIVGLCLDGICIISAQCASQVSDLALDCGLFIRCPDPLR